MRAQGRSHTRKLDWHLAKVVIGRPGTRLKISLRMRSKSWGVKSRVGRVRFGNTGRQRQRKLIVDGLERLESRSNTITPPNKKLSTSTRFWTRCVGTQTS